ncbi:hypothetical protein SK1NUM_21150 [Arachnia rubra]|nr:hypothetical protein SK1NUM_21150 [Arachnia rubra]
MRPEALTAQADGVQAYMHQDFKAFGTAYGDSVARRLKVHHLPADWRRQPALKGIDGEPVPHHFPRKDWVRHVS